MPSSNDLQAGKTTASGLATLGHKASRLLLCLGTLFILGCATAPDRQMIQSSYALPPADNSPLAEAAKVNLSTDPALSSVHLLVEGTSALAGRLMVIENAESSLDLQYYLYHHDTTGIITTWALLQAADRGVKVRLLLDDLETRENDYPLLTLNAHPNIEVRMYNPFFTRSNRWWQMLTSLERLNHRMHNKSLIGDGAWAIVGGRNIGDQYFGANQTVNFGDLDVLMAGPAVAQVSDSFDSYWNSAATYPLELLNNTPSSEADLQHLLEEMDASLSLISDNQYLEALTETSMLQQLQQQALTMHKAPVEFWSDFPEYRGLDLGENSTDEGPTRVLNQLLTLFEQAEEELYIVSPYFVPRDRGLELFTRKASSGVQVRIITNTLAATDVVAVHSGYSPYRKDLLRAGVELFEIKDNPNIKKRSWSLSSQSSLHAKTFIVDNRWVFIGSFNLDPRSAIHNTELGVLIDSPALAKVLKEGMDEKLQEVAYQVSLQAEDEQLRWTDLEDQSQLDEEPNAGFWRQFMASLLRLLPIEHQL